MDTIEGMTILPDSTKTKFNIFQTRNLLIAILIIAALMRIIGLGHKSLWVDEIIASYVSLGTDLKPTPDDLSFIYWNRFQDVSPPLRDYIAHYCFKFFGVNEAALRLFPVIFGILGIWLIYHVTKKWFDIKTALIAAFLVTISPFQLYHSQDGRMYTVLMFISVLTFYFLYQALYSEKRNFLYWVCFIIGNTINIYLSYFGFWVLITELTIALVWMFWDSRTKEKPWRYFGIYIGKLAVSVSFILNLYIPWIQAIWSFLLRNIHSPISYHSVLSVGEEDKQIAQEFVYYLKPNWEFFHGLLNDFGAQGIGAYFFLAFFLIGIYAAYRINKKITTGLVLWHLVPLLIAFAPPAKALFFSRYISFICPIYIMVVAIGIWNSAEFLGKVFEKNIKLLKPAILTLFFCLLCFLVNVSGIHYYYAHEKQNWRDATNYLIANVKNGDVVVTGPYNALWCVTFYGQVNGGLLGDIHPNPKYGGEWGLLFLKGKTIALAHKLNRTENLKNVSNHFPRIWYVSAYYRTYQYRLPAFYNYIESNFTVKKYFEGMTKDDGVYVFFHENPNVKTDPQIIMPIWK